MVEKTERHEPHVTTDSDGHAVVNGHGVRARRVLEALLAYRSIEETAAKMGIGEDFVEATIAYAVARMR